MKLYEITAQHRELEHLAENDDGTLAEALADTFEAITGDFNDKAISLIHVVRNIDSDTDAVDAEIKRLQDRKKAMTNTQNSMREYLRYNMEASGISKIDCPLFSITLGKGRDVVDVIDEALIPESYMATKTTTAPVKADILRALKSGESVPGTTMVKSKSSLRIK